MDILVEFYSKKYRLINPFESASGTLGSKIEFVVCFYDIRKQKYLFAMELPLSPSYGEMPLDIILYCKNHSLYNSKFFRIVLSYFFGFIINKDFNFHLKSSNQKSINIRTYPINSYTNILSNAPYIIKIKSSPESLERAINIINNTNNKFIVDFNKSLNLEQLLCFCNKVDRKRVFAIEQPLPTGEKLKSNGYTFIIDEGLGINEYHNIKTLNYNAFVFKPFANKFQTLKNCIRNEDKYLGMVGSNISGPIDCNLVNIINQYMPYPIGDTLSSPFLGHSLKDCILYYIEDNKLKTSASVFSYLKNKSTLVANSTFTLNQLKQMSF